MKKHNGLKKVLSLILVFSLVIGMMPMTTFASEDMVYISVSYDDKYIADKNGDYITKVGVPIAEVQAIDLEEYGLGDYLYDENDNGVYETTELQLVIYAHENLYGGDWDDVNFSGSPGSSYFEGGIFGFDENLNYFLNGEYPLLYEGWGATSDQIVIYPGDFLDVGSFTSWDFYADSNYGFHFFANEMDEMNHEYTVEEGKDLTVKLQRSYSGMGVGAVLYDEPDYNVYYGTAYDNAIGMETTDSSGMVTFNFENAGTYYIWADGGYGMEFSESVVSTPAFATITVTEAEGSGQEEIDKAAADAVIAKINEIGGVTLASEAKITAARDAYDTLTDAQKALVTNYNTLTEAEQELAKQKADKVEVDKAAAAEVDSLINDIGTVNVYNVKKVYKARNAYENLTDVQKAYVAKLDSLVAAEQKLSEMYEDAAKANHKDIYEKTHNYLSGLGTPTVGSTGGEWMVIDFTRAGYECPEGYYKNVEAFVKTKINDKEQLHKSKSTENARVILGLTSAGYDVTDVAGHNLLMGLTDMDYVKKQGVNGPIWALIAFDSYGYEIPVNEDANEQVTREGLIQYILDKRVDDGGWNLILSSPVNDPDMTGMAIQALAPYYDTNPAVKEAIDGALETLSNTQHENGGFSSTDGICSESCAQVIVALTALGINPETDARFIKNGVSVVDAMCLFAMEEGGFAHIPYAGLNDMATEQCQYALAAYYRFLDGKTSLYDMSDVELRSENDVTSDDDTSLDDNLTTDDETTPEDTTTPEGNSTPNDTESQDGTDNGKTPATGDNNNLVAWIALMGIALCGMTVYRRKNN